MRNAVLRPNSEAPATVSFTLKRLNRLIALFVGTALLSVFPPAQALAQVTFTQTGIQSGDYGGDAIVSGDFNNDGVLDLVTTGPTTLSFYKGLGNGTFAAPVNMTLPANAGGGGPIFAADLNQDGKLDVLVSYGYGGGDAVLVFLGNGDGTFKQGTSISLGGYATSMTVADFNGDHKPDFAATYGQGNQTWVYTGNGDGTFKLSQTLPYGGDTIVAGDFNADGKQDLAFGSGPSGNTANGMFLGNGDGTFGDALLFSMKHVDALAVGDFYNDRIQSLAALSVPSFNGTTADLYIYGLRYSNGKVVIANHSYLGQFTAGGPEYLAAGDLNGDFKIDLYLTGGSYNATGYTAYMLGNGNGTFQAPVNMPNNDSGIGYWNPIVRDLNLDSRNDAASAFQTEGEGGAQVQINTNGATNCTPPPANKLSVHICAPTSGQTVGSSFTFIGAGNAFNGIAKRMELWIDGKKVGQNLEDQLNVTAKLTKGKHTASFVVVDTYDNFTSSSVTFTAN